MPDNNPDFIQKDGNNEDNNIEYECLHYVGKWRTILPPRMIGRKIERPEVPLTIQDVNCKCRRSNPVNETVLKRNLGKEQKEIDRCNDDGW